jgi:hypothetical protein
MPSIVRTIAATTLLLSTCALATAAAPDSPPSGAASAAFAAASSVPAGAPRGPTILVVFDIDMEVSADQAAPEAARKVRDQARRQAYGAITTHLKAWGQREGVAIDTAVFAQGKKLDMTGRSVSHLVVEKITQAAIDNNTAGGPRVDTRTWKATAYDTSKRSVRQPATLGSEDFISDGPACFVPPAQAADDDCRADYLRRLTAHLRWIDLRWGEVQAEPATR